MGRPYKFSGTPMSIRGPSPAFGQDNERLVTELLGVEQAEFESLVQDAILVTTPTRGDASPVIHPEEMVRLGLLAAWDPDYRERLGLS